MITEEDKEAAAVAMLDTINKALSVFDSINDPIVAVLKTQIINEIPDPEVALLFKCNPEWVMTNRSDWVRKYHPGLLN